MERLGERGNIGIQSGTCSPDTGRTGLEPLGNGEGGVQEYVDISGKHRIDVQINIPKFGEEMHNGILNTKEMAEKWNWKSDSDELNWRRKPCALRISYSKETKTFRIQVWNDLLQVWLNLSLTREDLEKVLSLEKKTYKSSDLYCGHTTITATETV